MKAKDYAQQYNDNPTIETLMTIAVAFVEECQTIRLARNCQTNEAFFAVFEEQDQKWKAFARLVDDGSVADGGFADSLEMFINDAFILWQAYRQQRAGEA